MRRLRRQDLVNYFATLLREDFSFKRSGENVLDLSSRASRMAETLARYVDGPNRMVIETDPVDPLGTLGRWGADEPDPAGPPRAPKKII
ncbi:hypothetical protein [Sphingobium aromaticiconvertens]|uniref:hypothetical protein n=1 Tax=Sphingobium aromaticiconvertens TaxID=365341 RepID=UPI003018E03D